MSLDDDLTTAELHDNVSQEDMIAEAAKEFARMTKAGEYEKALTYFNRLNTETQRYIKKTNHYNYVVVISTSKKG